MEVGHDLVRTCRGTARDGRGGWLLAACVLLAAGAAARAAGPLEFKDGDRVVLIGGTWVEREREHGAIEAELTARVPDRRITFRNLGWSGDTVRGEARARFGTAADGFRHLEEQVALLKPTIALVAYGFNEAFDGESGLESFRSDYGRLLEMLAKSGARVVLLSPLHHEDPGRPLPDPEAHNRALRLYRDATRKLAGDRGLGFVDLLAWHERWLGEHPDCRMTDNGLHPTADGFAILGRAIADQLVGPSPGWRVELDVSPAGAPIARGAKVERLAGSAVPAWNITDDRLPEIAARGCDEGPGRVLRVANLAAGRHRLRIDGRVVAEADAEEWARGVTLTAGPEFRQLDQLRAAIRRKDELFFHRWRPQNETYLFLFRKHEQGQNAREIPQFDPLVAEQDRAIADAKRPRMHLYEVVGAGGESK